MVRRRGRRTRHRLDPQVDRVGEPARHREVGRGRHRRHRRHRVQRVDEDEVGAELVPAPRCRVPRGRRRRRANDRRDAHRVQLGREAPAAARLRSRSGQLERRGVTTRTVESELLLVELGARDLRRGNGASRWEVAGQRERRLADGHAVDLDRLDPAVDLRDVGRSPPSSSSTHRRAPSRAAGAPAGCRRPGGRRTPGEACGASRGSGARRARPRPTPAWSRRRRARQGRPRPSPRTPTGGHRPGPRTRWPPEGGRRARDRGAPGILARGPGGPPAPGYSNANGFRTGGPAVGSPDRGPGARDGRRAARRARSACSPVRAADELDPDGQVVPSTSAQCSGSETAGWPVMLYGEVKGVNAFCASKSAAGSASSRSPPTGRAAGRAVGVSTASYAAVASIVRRVSRERHRPASCSPTARPRRAASGSAAAAAPRPAAPSGTPSRGSTRTASKACTWPGPNGGRRPRPVAERLEQAAGVLVGRFRGTCGSTSVVGDDGHGVPAADAESPGSRSAAARKRVAGQAADATRDIAGRRVGHDVGSAASSLPPCARAAPWVVSSPSGGPHGALLIRRRRGLMVTRPVTLAGMRISDPPQSRARRPPRRSSGTAARPLPDSKPAGEVPGRRAGRRGDVGLGVAGRPNSGALVLPVMTARRAHVGETTWSSPQRHQRRRRSDRAAGHARTPASCSGQLHRHDRAEQRRPGRLVGVGVGRDASAARASSSARSSVRVMNAPARSRRSASGRDAGGARSARRSTPRAAVRGPASLERRQAVQLGRGRTQAARDGEVMPRSCRRQGADRGRYPTRLVRTSPLRVGPPFGGQPPAAPGETSGLDA